MRQDFTYTEYETLFRSLDVLEDRINSAIDEYDIIINNPISLQEDRLKEFGITREEAEQIMIKRAKENKATQTSYKEYLTLLKAKVIRQKDRSQIQTLIEKKDNSNA